MVSFALMNFYSTYIINIRARCHNIIINYICMCVVTFIEFISLIFYVYFIISQNIDYINQS